MKKNFLFFTIFLCTVISDQVSKLFIDSHFAINESKILIDDFLYLRYIRNPGIAFGISLYHPILMLCITLLIIFVLVYLFLKGIIGSEGLTGKIAIILILGGAAGNLIDRIRMKEVIDFIEMGIGEYRWPIYNLADVYVTCGMFMLIYLYTFSSKRLNNSENLTIKNE